MYLSPRRTLIALRSSRRTTSRAPLDRAAAGAPPAASLTAPPGRSRMGAAGDAGGSIAGLVCMCDPSSARIADRRLPVRSVGGTALPSPGTKLSVRSPLGNGPRGSARSRFAGAVKWPCLTILLPGGAAAGPDHADAAAAIARTPGAAPRALGCRALPRREPFMALVEAVAAGLVV